MRTPGVAIEIAMWGQYHEAEGLYENYVEGIAKHEQSIGARKGWYCEHPIYNPLIEVAADCKTAKAAVARIYELYLRHILHRRISDALQIQAYLSAQNRHAAAAR